MSERLPPAAAASTAEIIVGSSGASAMISQSKDPKVKYQLISRPPAAANNSATASERSSGGPPASQTSGLSEQQGLRPCGGRWIQKDRQLWLSQEHHKRRSSLPPISDRKLSAFRLPTSPGCRGCPLVGAHFTQTYFSRPFRQCFARFCANSLW